MVREALGGDPGRWRTMDGPGRKDLEEFLFARAMEHFRVAAVPAGV
jgi:hypothetical protein